VTLSPVQQELAITVVKVLVLFNALLGLFSVMTWAERRLLAFMQFRLGPNRTGPIGIFQPVELIKILLVMFLAGYFTRNWERLRDLL